MAKSASFMSPAQVEAIEQWRDAVESQRGVEDAILQQTDDYMERQREMLQTIADPQGIVT